MPTNIHFRSVHFSHDFCICRKNRKLVSHPQKLDLFLHNRLFHSGSYIRACQVRAVDFFMPTGKNAQKHIRRIRADREQRGAERRAALLIRPNDERKLVTELPSAENVCVDHRRRNEPNAVRAGLSQSFGENLNAENFFEIFKMKLHETLLLLNKNKKFALKMQSLRAAKRSMRARPGSDFAWSFYTAKLHIFSFFLKNCRIIRSILK